AAGIKDRDLPPELRHRAEHFQFTSEELLIEDRKLDVLLDRLDAAEAHVEIVDVAAQDAPGFDTFGAIAEAGRVERSVAVVGQGKVTSEQDLIRFRADSPGVLSLAEQNLAGRLRRPTDDALLDERAGQRVVEVTERIVGRGISGGREPDRIRAF